MSSEKNGIDAMVRFYHQYYEEFEKDSYATQYQARNEHKFVKYAVDNGLDIRCFNYYLRKHHYLSNAIYDGIIIT